MPRTNEELNEELLRVYRFLFSTVAERDRLKTSNQRLRRKFDEAEAQQIYAEDRLRYLQIDYDALMKENDQLVKQDLLHSVAALATLDLVGFIVDQEVAEEERARNFLKFWRTGAVDCELIHTADPVPPDPPSVGERADGAPLRCMSCNGNKEEDYSYLCEKCFELDNFHDLGLLSEFAEQWQRGYRDFPREGKNAKRIVSEPRDI